MSGFEVAGIVLGAFPLALHFLDDYREMAKRAGLWFRIRLEYTKCRNDVQFQRVAFSSHLRQLVLPLLVDDIKADQLLSDPGGPSWQEPSIDCLLRDRLGQTYDLYLGYITGMEEVMIQLNKELSMDSTPIQDKLTKGAQKAPAAKTSLKDVANKAEFQLYKVKFSNGEAKRKELLAKLQEYNDKLEKILSTSDRDAQLRKQRTAIQYKISIDSTLCNFWKQAAKLFQALASAWNCTCARDEHLTKLLLQHRTSKKPEFDVLFSAKRASGWQLQHTRISEETGNDAPTTQATPLETVPNAPLPIRQPAHRQASAALNLKSAMRQKNKVTATGSTSIGRQRGTTSQSSVTMASVQINNASPTTSTRPVPASLTLNIQPILSLCLSLQQPAPVSTTPGKPACYGYLTAAGDENTHTSPEKKFYLHNMWHQQTPSLAVITFDQILASGTMTRKQRYILALTLASSFLQLLDTPWLPVSWKRSDIVFPIHEQTQTDPSKRLQPYLRRDMSLLPLSSSPAQAQGQAQTTNLKPPTSSSPSPSRSPSPFGPFSAQGTGPSSSSNIIQLDHSLDNLGILLLELCFGAPLESQDRLFPSSIQISRGMASGSGGARVLAEEEKEIFNRAAAKRWRYEVEDEAGEEYSRAVRWCLDSVGRLDRWRGDMLKEVVEPLSRCAGWLEKVGI